MRFKLNLCTGITILKVVLYSPYTFDLEIKGMITLPQAKMA